MKVYLRKIDNQCINKQISIRRGILEHFFDNANNQDEVDMKGILSNYNDKVSILLATDPRLGGGIKKIINAEADKIKETRSDYELKNKKPNLKGKSCKKIKSHAPSAKRSLM